MMTVCMIERTTIDQLKLFLHSFIQSFRLFL